MTEQPDGGLPCSCDPVPPGLSLALAALSLTAAACSSDDDDASTTTTAPPTESSTTTTATDSTRPAEAATVEVAESDLGQILTSEGRTLYIFMPDNGGAPTCNDDCATTWPPLVADGAPTVGDGLDARPLRLRDPG